MHIGNSQLGNIRELLGNNGEVVLVPELILEECVAGVLLGLCQIALACADADSVPINHKGRLPTLAAQTTKHAHLAVKYQMCVIPQLPHVMLLIVTLRQGAPTSLRKCVFEGGRSLRSGPILAGRTKSTFEVFHLMAASPMLSMQRNAAEAETGSSLQLQGMGSLYEK